MLYAIYSAFLTYKASKRLLRQNGHSLISTWATYSPWLLDSKFIENYTIAFSRTLIDEYRCFELWQIALQQRGISGNYLEVGVWRGGSALLLGKSIGNSSKVLYLADTFEGVVNSGPHDSTYTDGEHADTNAADVKRFLDENLEAPFKILVGEFPSATGHLVPGKLALVHIDVDVYESGKQILEWCTPKMSKGGVIIFDDYGFLSTDGITKLVNEATNRQDFLLIYNLNGHAILVKKN
jgi:O-methyltransferase